MVCVTVLGWLLMKDTTYYTLWIVNKGKIPIFETFFLLVAQTKIYMVKSISYTKLLCAQVVPTKNWWCLHSYDWRLSFGWKVWKLLQVLSTTYIRRIFYFNFSQWRCLTLLHYFKQLFRLAVLVFVTKF